MTARLAGKVAFVTGIARGQGRAHAVRLAEEGADVIGLDVAAPVPSMAYPMGTLEDLQGDSRARRADGSPDRRPAGGRARPGRRGRRGEGRPGGVRAARRRVRQRGHITAGAPLLGDPPEVWQDVVDVNLTGVWNTLSAVVPAMIAQRDGGSIVVISSGAGLKGVPNLAGYAATKAAVVALAKSLANEVAHRGIRVNVIAPGTVDTPMVTQNTQQFPVFRPDLADPSLEDCVEVFRSINPMGLPWIDPVQISQALVFLASDESRHITGVVLPVDQGNAARP